MERSFHREPKTKKSISYGNVIVIYHGINASSDKHTYSLYAHLSRRRVNAGDTVTRGDVIGKTGDTENVPEHLHFEVKESPDEITWYRSGNEVGKNSYGQHNVDPMKFLKKPFLKNLEPLTDGRIKDSPLDARIPLQ